MVVAAPEDVGVVTTEQPTHRLELRDRGHLRNFREGPFIAHNQLVTHVRFLKKANNENVPSVYKVFPFGGSYSTASDVIALVFWYLLVVYNIVTIPIACYCETIQVNIVNAVILAILCMYQVTVIYLIFRNKAKLKSVWFTTQTSAEKYKGLQNCFIDISLQDTRELQLVGTRHRQILVEKMCTEKGGCLVLMICTSSYWKSCVIDPVISLSIMAVFSLCSIIVQLETIKFESH